MVTDSLIILARWRNHFSQLLDGLGVSAVRYTEIHTAEALVPEPSDCGVEVAIENLKRDISPGIDQNRAELIKIGHRAIRYEIHKLIISIWNEDELPEEWKESVIVPTFKKGDKTNCNNCRGISLSQPHHLVILTQDCFQHPAVKVNSICRVNYW